MPDSRPHPSPYAGSWYPARRAELENLLEKIFGESAARTGSWLLPGPLAFVVPHAGPVYSGRAAAAAYRHLAQHQPERVIVLGFSHRGAPEGAWIPDVDSYRTPLGDTSVDRDTAASLLAAQVFRPLPESKLCDHSVEIQLPLLQWAAPQASIVPIYVSSLSGAAMREAGQVLASRLDASTVLLASSDFTHYGASFGFQPFPVNESTPSRLQLLDEEVISSASSLEAGLFFESLDATSATVCGRDPIALLLTALSALPSASDVYQLTLDYDNSGEISGDWSHAVSYAALGYFPWNSFLLPAEDTALLLESARRTLSRCQQTGEPKPLPVENPGPALSRRAGVFVSLHRAGQLRGCIGRVSGAEPLSCSVAELTLSAALQDSRFEPVGPQEKDVDIEISVLSPLKRLTDSTRLVPGRDGAHVETHYAEGVLLPQVASGPEWTATRFLELLARKAGVSSDVYTEPGTRLSVFRAQIIH